MSMSPFSCMTARTALLAAALVGTAGAARAQSAVRTPLVRWTVEPRPLFESKKELEGETSILMTARGAMRLPDGTIVVADDGTKEVKWFAPDGRLLRRQGRDGEGPGEYKLVQLVGSCGTESVFVYDGTNSRLTTLTRDGKLASTRSVLVDEPEHKVPYTVQCGRTRHLVMFGWPSGAIPQADIPFRSDMELRIQSIEGAASRLLGRVPGPERHRFGTSAGPRPLGKKTVLAVGADRIYVGTGDTPMIQVTGFTGTRYADIALPFGPEPLTPRDVQNYIQRLIDLNPGRSATRIRDEYGALRYPDHFPTHGELMVDSDDNLWVEQYRRPGNDASRWVVLNRTGALIADVILPSRFRAIEVGSNFVLGTWEDADEVLHVQLLRLNRSQTRDR